MVLSVVSQLFFRPFGLFSLGMACMADEFIRISAAQSDGAADAIFRRYADRLIDFAREQLESGLRGKIDPDDVMQSVMRSFFRRQRNGAYELTSWESLWYLLVQIARRKCIRKNGFYRAEKRDRLREQSLQSVEEDSKQQGWQLDERQPTVEDVMALQDTVEWIMTELMPVQRGIVSLHLQGASTDEIAEQVDRSRRTVRRTIKLVRDEIQKLHSEIV